MPKRSTSTVDTHTAQGSTASTTIGITLPAGMLSTDVMFVGCNFTNGSSNSVVPTVTTPPGWTLIGTKTQAGSTFVVGSWAFAAPGNTAVSSITYGHADDVGIVMEAWSSVNTTTPFLAGTAVSSTGANSLTGGSLTSDVDGSLYAMALADWLGGLFSLTGFTDDENTRSNAAAAIVFATSTTLTNGSASGTQTFADSASATGQVIVGVPFLIRAAGGGAAAQVPYDLAHSPQHQAMMAM